jgi:hypothetical protein
MAAMLQIILKRAKFSTGPEACVRRGAETRRGPFEEDVCALRKRAGDAAFDEVWRGES